MWGLNGQQTNSGVSGVTLLNCEMKWCSRAETNTDQLWKMDIRRRKNWRLVKFQVAFLFHDCNKNSLLLWDFLSGFLAKLKWWTTLTYIITNCYNISALSLDLHIYPVWFQPFPMLNIKKDSWTKHLFFSVSPTTDWTQNTNCDSFPIALIHPPSYYTNKDTLLCLNFWGNMKSAIWENFAEFVPEVSVQPLPRSQPATG